MRIDGAGGDRTRVTCTASACRGGRSRRAVVRHGGLVQGRSLQGAARPLSPPLWASSIPSVVAVALVGLIAPGRSLPPLGVGAATGPGVLLLAHGPGGAGKDGDWVVAEVQQFNSPDTDMKIVICVCRYQPIEAQWQELRRGAPISAESLAGVAP
jgi:hypothetical protein